MSKTWNKVVLAALLTAGASAGILYLKRRQQAASPAADDDSLFEEPEEPKTVDAADRSYINLTPAAASKTAEEPQESEPETDGETGTAEEEHPDVHFSTL